MLALACRDRCLELHKVLLVERVERSAGLD
jgi:hypothetical protein